MDLACGWREARECLAQAISRQGSRARLPSRSAACGRFYASASAQYPHRATGAILFTTEQTSANQVWLSFHPNNIKAYHYNTRCPSWPTFAVLIKKLKRVKCYIISCTQVGSKWSGFQASVASHFTPGGAVGEGFWWSGAMATWSGHRNYLKSPLSPVSVCILAVPPVVIERRANLSGKESKCICVDSRGGDK